MYILPSLPNIPAITSGMSDQVCQQALQRAYHASHYLRNAALNVLRGPRHGRTYALPFSRKSRKTGHAATYTASAPGESPAVRLGHLRLSWQLRTTVMPGVHEISVIPAIYSSYATKTGLNIPALMEGGTSKIEPRPFKQKILNMAKDDMVKLFSRTYILK